MAIAFNVKPLPWFKITKFFKNMEETRWTSIYWGQSWWTPAWIQTQEMKMKHIKGTWWSVAAVAQAAGAGRPEVLVPVACLTFKSQFPAIRTCILSRSRSTFARRWEVVSVCLESLLIGVYHRGSYRSAFLGLASWRPDSCHPPSSVSQHHLCLVHSCPGVFTLCFHSCPCSDPFVSCCPWPCLDLCPVSDYRYLQICKSVVLSAFPPFFPLVPSLCFVFSH